MPERIELEDDEQGSGLAPQLLLVKSAGPVRGKKRSAFSAPPAPASSFQLIDCRPNLYDSLANAPHGPVWKVVLRAVEDVLRFASSKFRRESRYSNDNRR